MAKDLFDMVVKFFGNLEKTEEGKQALSQYDRKIVFELIGDDPFFVEIKAGKLSVKQGMPKPPDPEALHVLTDREAVSNLLYGRCRFVDVFRGDDERGHKPAKGKLYIRPSPKVAAGMTGGPLVYWLGKLIRIGQEIFLPLSVD